MVETYDAVVVGARCAGATVATLLARSGWRVLLVDRAELPSDTVSTHVLFPDTLARLGQLGALGPLMAAHDIPALGFAWRVLGHEVSGTFTAVGGREHATCVRRIVLDGILLDLARQAGADVRIGTAVAGLVGAGSVDDPIRGVVLASGEQVNARLVVGADGRMSTVASRLGLAAERVRHGEMAFLLAYWRGLPASGSCTIDVHEHSSLLSTACEDGLHLLSLAGPPELTRGTTARREQRYLEGLHHFPAVLNPRLLDRAERVSPVVVVPETMMRGHYRQAAGPGWALVGDAGHFKHPATAQGIGDAVHQAFDLADRLVSGDDLRGYADSRDDRAEDHYDWSYDKGRFATPRAAAIYAGLAADPVAGQQFLDTFTRVARPVDVVTPERAERWNAAWAYDDGRRAVRELVEDLPEHRLDTVVPACPEWTVRDLLAHLVGIAEDTVRGTYFGDAMRAWRDEDLAAAREKWTAAQVAARSTLTRDALLGALDVAGADLVHALRLGQVTPRWQVSAPVADLAVHLHDLAEALGVTAPGDAVTRLGFAAYRSWLGSRILESGLPVLRLDDGDRTWDLGVDLGAPDGVAAKPAATLRADRHELFRVVSGRRSAARIRAYDWLGDPTPYLGVIAPYPLPAD